MLISAEVIYQFNIFLVFTNKNYVMSKKQDPIEIKGKNPQGINLYNEYGVESDKSAVAAIFKGITSNDYPGAFVNIVDDPSDPNKCTTMHVDGDGSKIVQRFLEYHYYKKQDPTVFAGMADDAWSMNYSDIAAAGFVFGRIHFVDVFDCGQKDLKYIILKQFAKRFSELLELHRHFGFDVKLVGGETADLPQQVKTGVFNLAVHAWADKNDIISGKTKAGDVIFGIRADGQAIWEPKPIFPTMSNGLTLLRGGLMYDSFNEFADLGDGSFYKGRYEPDDKPKILGGLTVGEAILSPTRQWAIVIRQIMKELKERDILHMLHGISINTGGGATKIANIGQGVTYVKNMSKLHPLFQLVQEETGQPFRDMYTTFNCNFGVDIVGEDNDEFRLGVKTAVEKCGLEMAKLGFVNASHDGKNHVILNTPYGRFEY